MRLTRRDALAALAATGLTLGGADVLDGPEDFEVGRALDEDELEILIAVADVVYPPQVEATAEFVRTYISGSLRYRDDFRRDLLAGLRKIDRVAQREWGKSFHSLSKEQRNQTLRNMGLHRAPPDPEGTKVEQIRYYVLNELLYSFYATPVGGKLLGNQNPTGYPGGLSAYQQKPEDEG